MKDANRNTILEIRRLMETLHDRHLPDNFGRSALDVMERAAIRDAVRRLNDVLMSEPTQSADPDIKP